MLMMILSKAFFLYWKIMSEIAQIIVQTSH